MRNLTVKQLLRCDESEIERIHNIFDNVKPSNKLRKKEASQLKDLMFGEVATIRKDIPAGKFERSFGFLFNVDVYKLRLTEFYPVLNWIKDQLSGISKGEEHLRMESDANAPDTSELQVFGELNLLIPMARKYGQTYTWIAENWKYKQVFTEALFDKKHADYERQYTENIRRNTK